jgi:23S rRNA-/tRNA-specific pseudouridylate synthase
MSVGFFVCGLAIKRRTIMGGLFSKEEDDRGAGDVETAAATPVVAATVTTTINALSASLDASIVPEDVAGELQAHQDPAPSSPRVESKMRDNNLNSSGKKKRLSRNERRRNRKRQRHDGANDSRGGGARDPRSPAAIKRDPHQDSGDAFTAQIVPLELDGHAAVVGDNSSSSGSRRQSSVPAYVRLIQPYPYTFTSFAKQRWCDRTLLDVFSDEFQSYPRTYYERAIRMGAITVNDTRVDPKHVVRGGDVLRHSVHRHEPAVRVSSPESPFVRIVANTDTCLVIDKPPCLPIHPCGGYHENSLLRILNGVRPRLANAIHMIHRLDRLTSGLVVLAKSSETAAEWADAIQSRTRCQKLYLARVQGRFPNPQCLRLHPVPVGTTTATSEERRVVRRCRAKASERARLVDQQRTRRALSTSSRGAGRDARRRFDRTVRP